MAAPPSRLAIVHHLHWSTPWKQTLKKRCLARIKSQRAELLQTMRSASSNRIRAPANDSMLMSALRSIIGDQMHPRQHILADSAAPSTVPVQDTTMDSTMEDLLWDTEASPPCDSDDDENLSPEEHEELMLFLQQALIEDLKKEEEKVLKELEEADRYEAAVMQSLIDSYEQLSTNNT
eukprot:GILK01005963.1.p1 GENE.GILK01005963.1~~GILK01005963.1.p1  ORF type:complete len:193 (-),score=29.94 GILK01005963.1:136-669(-)